MIKFPFKKSSYSSFPRRSRYSFTVVVAKNRILMTVTQQDAEDFGISTEALAERWAKQLNTAFDKPPLAIALGNDQLLLIAPVMH